MTTSASSACPAWLSLHRPEKAQPDSRTLLSAYWLARPSPRRLSLCLHTTSPILPPCPRPRTRHSRACSPTAPGHSFMLRSTQVPPPGLTEGEERLGCGRHLRRAIPQPREADLLRIRTGQRTQKSVLLPYAWGYGSCTHTLTLSHMHSHTLTIHTPTHTHVHTLTYTHPHTHTLAYTLVHTHSHLHL